MRELPTFRDKVREYYRSATDARGRRYTQATLAEALLFNPADLSRKLSGSPRSTLSTADVRQIVKTLAEWGAITSQIQARELLALMDCTDFSSAEWATPPLATLCHDRMHSLDTAPITTTRRTRPVARSTGRSWPIYHHHQQIVHISFSSDNRQLALADIDDTIYLINLGETEGEGS